MNSPGSSAGGHDRFDWRKDGLILLSLALLAALFVAISWRKWPDPMVDFGRELYLPWQITQGAVYGLHLESPYGPLSPYINAAVFAVAGPGMMHLVAFNLGIYAAIVLVSYTLLLRGWGRPSAWAGTAFFIGAFSFLQVTKTGNYNYATPYSHEAVHGLLCCLLLVLALLRWRRAPSAAGAALAGLVVGATALMKAEILAAALGLCGLAALLEWRERRRLASSHVLALAGASLLPFAAFSLYFSAQMPTAQALRTSARAILNVVSSSDHVLELVQLRFSGFDRPLENFLQHAQDSLISALVIALLVLVAGLSGRFLEAKDRVWIGWTIACLAIVGAFVLGLQAWLTILGHSLLALSLAAMAMAAWDMRRGASTGVEERLLLAALAALMMMRMPLNGRVWHYGFYQAAVAGMVAAASVTGGWARWSGGARARLVACLAAVALLAGMSLQLLLESRHLLSLKTLPVGVGADCMLSFQVKESGSGALVRLASGFAERNVGPGEKLLVLPEGIMVNYLSRRATPLITHQYFGAPLASGNEARLVAELKARPPAWVFVMSRNLGEYGVARYGDKVGHGRLLMDFVRENYVQVDAVGADPLDPNGKGARYYKLRR